MGKIESLDDAPIREFINASIKLYGVEHTKRSLLRVAEDISYGDGNHIGMKLQKDKLDDLSFVMMLIFNKVLCRSNIAQAINMIVDAVVKEEKPVEEAPPAEVKESLTERLSNHPKVRKVEYIKSDDVVRCYIDVVGLNKRQPFRAETEESAAEDALNWLEEQE